MSATTKMCACGLPLHYDNAMDQAFIEAFITIHGECLNVRLMAEPGVVYRVPRHYIALHGIKAWELPDLAARYGFEKVIEDEVRNEDES